MANTRRLFFLLLGLCVVLAPVMLRAADKVAEPPVATLENLPRDARMALFESQQLLEKGETDKAVEELGKYVHSHEKKDDQFLVRYQYATMLVQVDRREDALKEYERVVQLEPRYDAGWMGLGETAYGLGQYAKAADALTKGYELSNEKRPELLYYAAAARLQAGDAQAALTPLEELTSGRLGTPRFEWYRGLVSACLQTQDAERGQAAVNSMLETFENHSDAWYLAFQYYVSVNDLRQAAVSLTVVSYLRPLSRQERLQLGDLYAAVEVPAVAAENYVEATQDSASAGEIERVASAYLAAYQTDQALRVLNAGLQEKPTFRLWSLLGDVHVMEKNFTEAYSAFAECVKLDPEKPRPYLMMGYCAIELDDPDLAMTHLEVIAGNEEFADRADMLIQRAKIMQSAPTPASEPETGQAGGGSQSLSSK